MRMAELSNDYRYHITYIDVICFCDVGCISITRHRFAGGGGVQPACISRCWRCVHVATVPWRWLHGLLHYIDIKSAMKWISASAVLAFLLVSWLYAVSSKTETRNKVEYEGFWILNVGRSSRSDTEHLRGLNLVAAKRTTVQVFRLLL
jgi:hypothetical protein